MELYNSFVMEAKRALAELGMDEIIFSQNEDSGEITIETGVYLLGDETVTTDPKVGCQCHQCDSCKEAGR